MLKETEELVQQPLILIFFLVNHLILKVFTVSPGDVDEEEKDQVDDVAKDKGKEAREENQPCKKFTRIIWNYLKLWS